MAGMRMIEVPLPEGVEPSAEDLELLQTTLQAIVSLRHEGSRELQERLHALESEGWSVQCRVGWIAEGRRGREFEQAFGATRDRAVTELCTLTAMDEREGCSA